MSSGASTNKLLEKFVPVLLVMTALLLVAVGVLVGKVIKLEKTGSGTGTTVSSPLGVTEIKTYAKKLGLNTKDFNKCLDDGQTASVVTAEQEEGSAAGVGGTPAFIVNGHLVSGALPYEMFERIIEFELAGGDWAKPDDTVKDLVDPEQPIVNALQVEIDLGDSPRKGTEGAPVTIVEFSDFECPYCARFFSQTLGDIEKNYVDTGKVLMVFKQFPLQFHPYAQKAAEASLCAKQQGKFWEMHDKLFSEVTAANNAAQ